MTSHVKKSDLSPARQRLVEKLQQIHFGEIKNLHVRDGEPVFDPSTVCFRLVKCGADNEARPEAALPDFKLKHQVLDLFHELDRLGTGVIPELIIANGLPLRVRIPTAI